MLLWRALRARPAGLRFAASVRLGPYVLDFFCPACGLAVEVDGEAHTRGDQPARDVERDKWLASENVRVLRVAAADVLADVEAVVRLIESASRAE